MTDAPTITLAELGAEFDLAYAVERASLAYTTMHRSDLRADPVNAVYQAAVSVTSDIIDRIAATPATSLADLRVKARALRWYHETVEGPEHGTHTSEALAAQLVAGLLSEVAP